MDLALVHAGVAHSSRRSLGRCGDGVGTSLCWRCESLCDGAGRAVGDLVDVASGKDVADVSATRLDDDVGRTLEVKEELLKVSEVLQSWFRGKLTLSPQMVLRPQVLNVKAALRVNLHTVDSLMVFQKRVLGSKFVGLGIWNRSRLALNLYGVGACCCMLYAIRLLGCTTYSSPVLRVIWWI